MNNSQLKLSRIFLITLIGLISSVIIPTNKGNAQTMESYKVIDVTSEIADGKEKEVHNPISLFEGGERSWRIKGTERERIWGTIVQLT